MNRKTVLQFTISCAVLLLSSCYSRGDYLCACSGGVPGNYSQEQEVSGKNEKDARAKCRAKSDAAGTIDGIRCDLKQ